MEDLPHFLTRDYLVECKYRLAIRAEAFEAGKDQLTDKERAAVRTDLVRERLRIDKLDELFDSLTEKLEEHCAIVDSEA